VCYFETVSRGREEEEEVIVVGFDLRSSLVLRCGGVIECVNGVFQSENSVYASSKLDVSRSVFR